MAPIVRGPPVVEPPSQSLSLSESQPLGQQPSSSVHAVMLVLLQVALQFSALPVS